MELDILIEETRWEALDLEDLTARAVRETLSELGIGTDCSLSLMASDDARIAKLNADFRGKPRPTNVLSWPAEERGATVPGRPPALPEPDPFGTIELGDIALAFETCLAEAAEAGKPFSDHVTHLIVHGLLHLLGYDHVDDSDAALMEGLEVKILGKMGLDDPYRGN